MKNVHALAPRLLSKAIDQAGSLRSQIAALQDELKKVETEIKNGLEAGNQADGQDYRAAHIVSDEKRVDWKSVAAKLKPSTQLVTAHTKEVHKDYVKITARVI